MIFILLYYFCLYEILRFTPHFPRFSDLGVDIEYYLDYAFDYILSGLSLISNWFSLPILFPLVLVVVTIEAALFIYGVVMWILEKIPGIDIDR